MKESKFQGWIIDVAQANGWRVFHCPTPMRPVGGGRFVPDHRGAGLPDLIMLHTDPPRLIFAEVKNEGGVLSDGQLEFLRLARGVVSELSSVLAGAEMIPLGVYTWRPGVEHMIETILKSKVCA